MQRSGLNIACYGVSGLCLLGAGGYLVLGPDKGLGISLSDAQRPLVYCGPRGARHENRRACHDRSCESAARPRRPLAARVPRHHHGPGRGDASGLGCWWLARPWPGFVSLIVAAGAVYHGVMAFALLAALVDAWPPPRRSAG
jgi:hypothetical protein